jgi:hypothetical protein
VTRDPNHRATISMLKTYHVFNVEQIEELPETPIATPNFRTHRSSGAVHRRDEGPHQDRREQSMLRALPRLRGNAAEIGVRNDSVWTADALLRQVVYEGLREDKDASDVRRE